MSIQPALLLLELRSRAYLEIQADDKGHLTRVHRVPPTLYRLPATYDGMPLFGVCGSLRTQHWVELLQQQECIALLETRRDGRLPALRMATYDDAIEEVARSLGFQIDPLPCEAIARWAGSLAQAKEALSSWGWSSLTTDLYQLQHLHPNTAQFSAVRSGNMVVEPNVGCRLFRFDDPSIPGLQVHVLGTIKTNGSTGFSFIHDSRWGVWIAQEAFARMLRAAHSREDVYPWPVPYDPITRDFWLPARMRPPAVVERALTLCSGSGPKEVLVEGVHDADRIRLDVQGSGEVIGRVGLVYEAFTPGSWLCYQWVPHEIASRVASLLGGQLSALYEVRN